jgi:hypothetical protein
MPVSKLYGEGALINVHVTGWTGSIILNPEDLGFAPDELPKAFKLGQKMLVPEDVIANLRNIEGRARRAADYPNGLRFPIGSAKFVPKANIPGVIETLKKCREEYLAAAEKLADNLEEYRLQMIPVYEEAAKAAYLQQKPEGVQILDIDAETRAENEFIDNFMRKIKACYPSPESLRQKFDIDWCPFEIGESTGEFATEEWRTQARAKLSSFIDDVVGQLREETIKLCSRVAASLKEGKIIRSSTVDNLREYVNKFQTLNFVGDGKIDTQLNELKTQFLTHDSKELSEPEMQVELKRKLNEIIQAASDVSDVSSISGGYRRKVNWDDETIIEPNQDDVEFEQATAAPVEPDEASGKAA